MSTKGLGYNGRPGFAIPKCYFEDFEARMLAEIDADNQSGLPEHIQPFKIPPAYFEQLEQRLLADVQPETRSLPWKNRRSITFVAGVAAAIAILFLSTVLDPNVNDAFEIPDPIAVENYLLQNLENPQETPWLKEGDFSYATSGTDLNQEAVLEYLNENLEDPSLLFNED